jgi:hypothetical protein
VKIDLELTPAPIALILIAVALAAAIWAYGSRYPALTPRRRAILLWTRLLTLAALVAASLAPELRYPTAGKERNRLLVLVDHSGSMSVRDASGGRSRRRAADSAAVALATELGRRFDVRLAPFDAALGPFGRDARSLEADRAGAGARSGETALGDAIREALHRADPDSVAALVVLSDGGVNRGEDPERAVDASLPAFTLSVGSPADPPTVGIAGVEAPGEAIVGAPTVIHVTVRQGKRPPARGVARLLEDGRELGRAPFALETPGSSSRVAIPFTPSARGKHFLWVALDEITDDPMRENKRRLIAIDVREARRRVVLVSSSWDWDLRSFARGLEADTAWTAVRATPAGPDQVAPLGSAPRSFASILDGAEAVAIRYDARVFTAERSADLARFVERGGGVLLWLDPEGRIPPETAFSRSLGLVWRFWGDMQREVATADLSPAGRTHQISLLGGDAASAASAWRALPPVKPLVALGVSPGGPLASLVQGKINDQAVPLLLAGRVGAGRVAVLNAAGVYRWGLTASGLGTNGGAAGGAPGGAGIEATFFGGLCRWLASGDEDQPVRITAPEITPEGRAIAVRVTATIPAGSSGGAGIANARARAFVRARRVGGGAAAETTLALSAPGSFSGSIATSPGTYVLSARVESGGKVIGRDSIRVAVGGQGIEFESLAAEPDLLARLAEHSSGASAPVEAPGPVLERLRAPDLARSRLAEMDLFHNPFLFAVLVLGLTVEWALRRRFHLL